MSEDGLEIMRERKMVRAKRVVAPSRHEASDRPQEQSPDDEPSNREGAASQNRAVVRRDERPTPALEEPTVIAAQPTQDRSPNDAGSPMAGGDSLQGEPTLGTPEGDQLAPGWEGDPLESAKTPVKIPPSLSNIHQELAPDTKEPVVVAVNNGSGIVVGPDDPVMNLSVRLRRPFVQHLSSLVADLQTAGVRTSKTELVEMCLWALPFALDANLTATLRAYRAAAPRDSLGQ